jgi:hypothetical protein
MTTFGNLQQMLKIHYRFLHLPFSFSYREKKENESIYAYKCELFSSFFFSLFASADAESLESNKNDKK